MEDNDLKENVHREFMNFLGARGKPSFQYIQRWPLAIPQYTQDARQAREHIDPLKKDNLYLAGNWVGGISVPDSIESGKRLAKELGAQVA